MADKLRAIGRITRVLRDISHELRSPLARMRVAVGLARQPAGDPARRWNDWNAKSSARQPHQPGIEAGAPARVPTPISSASSSSR